MNLNDKNYKNETRYNKQYHYVFLERPYSPSLLKPLFIWRYQFTEGIPKKPFQLLLVL